MVDSDKLLSGTSRKLPPWSGMAFKPSQSTLDAELSRILHTVSLSTYLNRHVAFNYGFRVGVLHSDDPKYSNFPLYYGLIPFGGDLKLYSLKETPPTFPEDVFVIRPSSFSDISEEFYPSNTFPSVDEFISSLNDSLKQDYKTLDYLIPTAIIEPF